MYMKCVKSIYKAKIEVKKSKFISYLVPIENYKQILANLKIEHPKANHIVYAYRELNEYNQVVENSSDDGEPKGAAGVPTLNQLRGADLIDSAIITVRYFGGVKLGVGGMARAYSQSAKSAIESAKLLLYERLVEYKIEKKYVQQRQIEYYLKMLNIIPYNREFLEDRVVYELKISSSKLEKLKKLMV